MSSTCSLEEMTYTHTRTQKNNNKSWPDKQSWLIPTDRPVDFPFFNIWWWFTNNALAKRILQESNLQASSTFLQHSLNIHKPKFCQLLAPAMWPTGAQQTTGYHGGPSADGSLFRHAIHPIVADPVRKACHCPTPWNWQKKPPELAMKIGKTWKNLDGYCTSWKLGNPIEIWCLLMSYSGKLTCWPWK